MGDAVLGYLVGNMLYQHYPDVQEDALSLMRAQLVRGKTLAQVAGKIDLSEYLMLGVGELRSGGRQRASILADALEAVIGAVHEDGGIEHAQRLVHQLFSDLTLGLDAESLKDAKTRLQELLQGNGLDLPVYTVEEVSGADHQRQYTVKCEAELKSDGGSKGVFPAGGGKGVGPRSADTGLGSAASQWVGKAQTRARSKHTVQTKGAGEDDV